MNKTAATVLSCVVLSALFAGPAGAQDSKTLADLQDPKKIGPNELQSLVAGAKVTSIAANGSTRYWENSSDGKFIASSTNAGNIGANRASKGQGSWHVSPEGQYCVNIDWARSAENWCRFIFKSGDKYFGANTDRNPSTKVFEIEFKK
jgi:hypothetical protein